MIKCDLCGKLITMDDLMSTQYSVPEVVDICTECSDIIFNKKIALDVELKANMREFVRHLKYINAKE